MTQVKVSQKPEKGVSRRVCLNRGVWLARSAATDRHRKTRMGAGKWLFSDRVYCTGYW